MSDGETVIKVSTGLTASDDSNMLSQVSIQLLNPVDIDTENISVALTGVSDIKMVSYNNYFSKFYKGEGYQIV